MNIALEETQEYVEGVARGHYGDAFIRGNNGTCWRALPHCASTADTSARLDSLLPLLRTVLYITAKE